jgi:DNA-binding ferritin-like protein
VERSLLEVMALMAQGNGRLTTAERTRVSHRIVADARQSLATANADLQKARAAAEAHDFTSAQETLSSVRQRVSQVIARLDTALKPQNARRRS